MLSHRDLIVHVRPPKPPMKDDKAKEDEFNTLIQSGSLPELSDSVKVRFAAVTAQVNKRIGRGSPAAQPGDDIVITTLGTGSAVPTPTRNGTSPPVPT